MIIWRVEHERSRIGPYAHLNNNEPINEEMERLIDRMANKHLDSAHPSPCEDGIRFNDARNDSMRCGFRTKRDLETWFDGFLPELKRYSFRVCRYQVDDAFVAHGHKQVMFHSRAATMLDSSGGDNDL